MQKKLTKHGNSLAVVIERPILELLDITADTVLDIHTDGELLIIAPVRDLERGTKFTAALERANHRYGRMLSRLA